MFDQDQDRVPLSVLPHEIKVLTGKPPPTYRALYNACVDAKIPADRGDNGRWTVARRNVPVIARIFAGSARAA
jgi:hypothetical protein